MTQTANNSVSEQGIFRRAFAIAWAFLQSLDSTGFDYTLDRIERLEREVGLMKEELRQIRAPGTGDARNASATALERRLGDWRVPGSSHPARF